MADTIRETHGTDADADAADGARNETEALAKALGLAAAYVNRRERTVAELHAHLERKGIAEANAAAAVAELRAAHLVDDDRFAQMFVADKRALEQWGTERIRRGLRERGIDRELAERALAAPSESLDGTAPQSDFDRALELLRRRFPAPPRERRERDRALGMLLRKGYESELALDALAAHAREL